jgi:hypothetical protein
MTRRARRPRVTILWREAGQGATRPGAEEPPAPPWHGQRVRIEELAGFAARWRLAAVGGDWPEGEACPRLYLVEVQDRPARGGSPGRDTGAAGR